MSSKKRSAKKPRADAAEKKGPCLKFDGLDDEQIKAVKQVASEFRRGKLSIDGYKAGHQRAIRTTNKGGKKSRGSGGPRPQSGFITFSKAERPKIAGLSFADTGRELGKRWRALSAAQQAKWTAKGKAAGSSSKSSKRKRSSSSDSE